MMISFGHLLKKCRIEIIGKHTQVKRKGAVHYDAAAATLRLVRNAYGRDRF
jgi:hypothetical protein